jgi:hypothetical protein
MKGTEPKERTEEYVKQFCGMEMGMSMLKRTGMNRRSTHGRLITQEKVLVGRL